MNRNKTPVGNKSEGERNKNTGHHSGHRSRLKERYLNNGIDSLLEHEILELMLFYCIPRVDTKPMAHRLIEEYGSLASILSSTPQSLMRSGLTKNAALYLGMLSDVDRWIKRKSVVGCKLGDYNQVGEYLLGEFSKDKTERFVMIMLDTRDCIIEQKTICTGSFSSAQLNTRTIIEACVLKGAAKVIFAHNHPSGRLEVSIEDHAATRSLEYMLSNVDVSVIEHYIVGRDNYIGIIHSRERASAAINDSYSKGYGFHTEI